MVGQKTHEQQQRIINTKEKTKSGDENFPAAQDLKTSKALRKAKSKGGNLTVPDTDLVDSDDRNILRGRNQESRGRG
jgi:hypothetical protein